MGLQVSTCFPKKTFVFHLCYHKKVQILTVSALLGFSALHDIWRLRSPQQRYVRHSDFQGRIIVGALGARAPGPRPKVI